MMAEPLAGRVYEIELCSGERRLWRYAGADARGIRWWQDGESGLKFSESSLMYAWKILGEAAPAAPCGPDLKVGRPGG